MCSVHCSEVPPTSLIWTLLAAAGPSHVHMRVTTGQNAHTGVALVAPVATPTTHTLVDTPWLSHRTVRATFFSEWLNGTGLAKFQGQDPGFCLFAVE